MKRIVLGILLVLVQNGFAYTDKQYKEFINKTNYEWKKQALRCEMIANNHPFDSNVQVCIKAVILLKQASRQIELGYAADNTAIIFYKQDDKINAYKYFLIAARAGCKVAQTHLDILCKESPWVCK